MPTSTRTATALKINVNLMKQIRQQNKSSKTTASDSATKLPTSTEKVPVTHNPFQNAWTTVDNRNFSARGSDDPDTKKRKTRMKRAKHL